MHKKSMNRWINKYQNKESGFQKYNRNKLEKQLDEPITNPKIITKHKNRKIFRADSGESKPSRDIGELIPYHP